MNQILKIKKNGRKDVFLWLFVTFGFQASKLLWEQRIFIKLHLELKIFFFYKTSRDNCNIRPYCVVDDKGCGRISQVVASQI